MNYASIDDMLGLYRTSCPVQEIRETLFPESTDPASKFLSECSDRSIETLKRVKDRSELDVESANLIWWAGQSLKKFRQGCLANESETYRSFLNRNDCCNGRGIPVRHLRRIRVLLAEALGGFSDCCEMADGRFGPGAVAEKLDVIQKYGTIEQFSYDPRAMTLLPRGTSYWTQSSPARLCCVPKTFDKFRLITVENVENSFGQQYIRNAMLMAIHHSKLRGSVMDLGQSGYRVDKGFVVSCGGLPEMKQRARCISASASARLATLDLSDASDSISWQQIVEVFPSLVVSYLERFRSPEITVPQKGGRDEVRKLHIYAGMGNATTFPVETLFFWAVVTSICEWLGDLTPVTVFGDDIICGNRAANHPLFLPELERFGLKINVMKSGTSLTPGFRESCGTTALCGVALQELIRYYGFDLEDPDSRIDACSFVNRVADRFGNAKADQCLALRQMQSVVGYGLSEALTQKGVPNLPMLAREAEVLSVPWFPFSDSVPFSFAMNGEDSEEPCYQRLAYKVLVREPNVECRLRRHLNPGEVLGVLNGQITTDTCLRIREKESKTLLKYSTRNTRLVIRWVFVR